MEGLHEPYDKLSTRTLDMHRAIVSLMEELEAVDWYQQRADNTSDEELKKIVEHNRDEEIEHCCMVIEWLRRNSEVFSEQLDIYLYSSASIVEVESLAVSGGSSKSSGGSESGLKIGKPGKQK